MQEVFIRKYFFIALLLISLTFGVLLFWPFLTTIIISIILAVVFSPVYNFLLKKIKNSSVSALLTVFIFILAFCIPLAFIFTLIFGEIQDVYRWLSTDGKVNALFINLDSSITDIIPGFNIDVQGAITSITSNLSNSIGNILSTTASTLISFILIVLTMFYFLKDGIAWKKSVELASPLTEESTRHILDKFYTSFNGIIKGYLLVGLIQGILTAIGLWIFGVPNPVLWGLISAIASFVPSIGPAIVPVPAILFLLAIGQIPQAIGLAIWSVVIIGGIDNVINPYFVGKSVNIHPITALFSVFGGIALMGPFGIVIGPLIISFIHTLLIVSKTELKF